MEIYTKVHSSKVAVDEHKRKIEQRGGKTAISQFANSYFHIDYCFPGEQQGKPPKKKKYDILSPDGISIRMPDKGLFKYLEEALAYFGNWKLRFERQGYYSYNFQRISLELLASACTLHEIS